MWANALKTKKHSALPMAMGLATLISVRPLPFTATMVKPRQLAPPTTPNMFTEACADSDFPGHEFGVKSCLERGVGNAQREGCKRGSPVRLKVA